MKAKKITSVEISNTSWGLCRFEDIIRHKLILYRRGRIKHLLYNGLSDSPIQEHSHAINAEEMEAFFERLVSEYKVQDWEPDYSVDVCDGMHWEIMIRHSDHTIRKIKGTVEPPPRGKKLREDIYKLADYVVEPWLF